MATLAQLAEQETAVVTPNAMAAAFRTYTLHHICDYQNRYVLQEVLTLIEDLMRLSLIEVYGQTPTGGYYSDNDDAPEDVLDRRTADDKSTCQLDGETETVWRIIR
ncbi:hypothetical protein PoB_003144800 [Plakobranchus ocellatus]|uniref:Uncharacterized protein n=1 Tax=Plakobranchus ocellatus TaxID=259542 RepID=A0AAV4ACE3_9GAST|nr:hypothetical protein PoB_003144800 [Plakobranchus ocellatus]